MNIKYHHALEKSLSKIFRNGSYETGYFCPGSSATDSPESKASGSGSSQTRSYGSGHFRTFAFKFCAAFLSAAVLLNTPLPSFSVRASADESVPASGPADAQTAEQPAASPASTAAAAPSTKPSVIPDPKFSSFEVIHKKKFEKKKAFGIKIKGLKYAGGIKRVDFEILNEKGKKVFTKKADKSKHNTCFTATIKLKKLNYKLKKYKVKAVITSDSGQKKAIDRQPAADETVKCGKLKINTGNAAAEYKLKNAYIPGNIKKVEFRTYYLKDGRSKHIGTFKASESKKNIFTFRIGHKDRGKYEVKAFGYAQWGKKILLHDKKYSLEKDDMGKNGWYYEGYGGRKLRFYYKNNKKVTDVTDILGLRRNGSNRLVFEINRAAATVTAYAYDDNTGSYDIPVRAFSVSVGRDIYTRAGTGGLNENSSYTPLGTFSISSNGSASKFSVKPMHEPNGSVVYARWASHIVGNVYFHAIAVGSNSHYALSSYDFNRLGGAASAGCVRMCVYDAKWIYDYAAVGSTVKISYGSSSHPGPLGKPALIKINGINYDPTDPEVSDSRKASDYKSGRTTGYIKHDGTKVGNIAD